MSTKKIRITALAGVLSFSCHALSKDILYEGYDVAPLLKANRCTGFPSINPPPAQELTGGPLTARGYPKSHLIEKLPSANLYWAYSDDRSGYALIVVHKENVNVKVGGLKEQPDGTHKFNQGFIDSINDRLSCLNHTPNNIYAYHYVKGYSTEEPSRAYGNEHIEAPLFSTDWRFERKTKRYLPRIHQSSGPFSAIAHCIEKKVSTDSDTAAITADCPGYVAPESVLAHKGFRESSLLLENDRYHLYSGRTPGTASYPGSKNRKVFVMEHAIARDEPIIPYTDNIGGTIDPAWLAEVEALPPIAKLVSQVQPNNVIRLEIHHYVSGFEHPNTKNSYGTEEPVVITQLAYWDRHKKLQQGRYMGRLELPPPNTVVEALAEHQRLVRYKQISEKYPRINQQKLQEYGREAKLVSAKRYGTQLREREFWSNITADDEISDLERIHDGWAYSVKGNYSFAGYYIFFMERFGNQCQSKLKPGYETVTIKTTKTRTQGGKQVGEPDITYRPVRLDVEYEPDFRRHFDLLWNDKDTGPSAPQLFGELFRMLSNPGFAARGMERLASILSQPARHIGRLFEILDCEDPSLEQIRKNLLRASNDKPSLQDSRLDSYGRQRAPVNTDAKLVYTSITGDAHVEYGYSSVPVGWLPLSPAKLLADTHADVGRYSFHHSHGWIPTMVHVRVMGAGAYSLRRMSVGRWNYTSSFDLLWINQDMMERKINEPLMDPRQMLVVCEYNNAEPVIFWHPKRYPGVDLQTLRSLDPEHPLLAIKDPMTHCPQKGGK